MYLFERCIFLEGVFIKLRIINLCIPDLLRYAHEDLLRSSVRKKKAHIQKRRELSLQPNDVTVLCMMSMMLQFCLYCHYSIVVTICVSRAPTSAGRLAVFQNAYFVWLLCTLQTNNKGGL